MTTTDLAEGSTTPTAVPDRARWLAAQLDPHGVLEEDAAGVWARWERVDVRAMAHVMRRHGVRLVALTARPDGPDGALRAVWHWDLGSTMLHVSTPVRDGTLQSIADLVPGADWAEREVRDYYGVTFAGRAGTPPLMLLPGDPPGLFARTADRAHDADPGRTARRLAETGPAPREEVEPA